MFRNVERQWPEARVALSGLLRRGLEHERAQGLEEQNQQEAGEMSRPAARLFKMTRVILKSRDAMLQLTTRGLAAASASGDAPSENLVGASDVPYWLQSDESLERERTLRRRFALRNHTQVLAALSCWWDACMHTLTLEEAPRPPTGTEHVLAFDGYGVAYLKIFRAMMSDFREVDAHRTLAVDWEHDRQGLPHISREHFGDALFQVRARRVADSQVFPPPAERVSCLMCMCICCAAHARG